MPLRMRAGCWACPIFWNVVSNLPFAVIGAIGLRKFRGIVNRVLFSGSLLTALGSAYYHLAPSDARLVWGRLPMTLVFVSFLAGLIAQGREERWVAWILGFLVGCGIASVWWWDVSGDLRPYAVVQFGPALVMLPWRNWPSLPMP
jgi:uncharacterized membrane-anchored protein YitT (DUF2179 family)